MSNGIGKVAAGRCEHCHDSGILPVSSREGLGYIRCPCGCEIQHDPLKMLATLGILVTLTSVLAYLVLW